MPDTATAGSLLANFEETCPPKRIILDTDPGIDDPRAILLALASDEISLEGLSTVHGNCSLEQATINALSILELAQAGQIPVAKGCELPLVQPSLLAPETHGETGLGYAKLPQRRLRPLVKHGSDFLINRILFSPGEITVVAIGPLTNLALTRTELSDKTETNPYDLSATWRKMVAPASVISMETDIVIFDEPTTGQDAPNIARIANVIKSLRGRTASPSRTLSISAPKTSKPSSLSQGRILLDGQANDILGQEDILATTYVDPPQSTRLGKKLGFSQIVKNQEEFLNALQQRSPR